MSSTDKPIVDEKTENPKVLAMAGGVLFALGLAATFLVYINAAGADKAGMVMNAAVLLALGYPLLLHVRSLKKIADLEQRVRDLERRP